MAFSISAIDSGCMVPAMPGLSDYSHANPHILAYLKKNKAMSNLLSIPNISVEKMRHAIQKEYEDVALDPDKGYHFHTGREAAIPIGYDETLYASLPEKNIASFAGTGNPFKLGPINPGDTVINVGSGSGLDLEACI